MFPLAFVAGSLQGHWWGFISRNYVVWPIFYHRMFSLLLKELTFYFYSTYLLQITFLSFALEIRTCLQRQFWGTGNIENPQSRATYFKGTREQVLPPTWEGLISSLRNNVCKRFMAWQEKHCSRCSFLVWYICLLSVHLHKKVTFQSSGNVIYVLKASNLRVIWLADRTKRPLLNGTFLLTHSQQHVHLKQ